MRESPFGPAVDFLSIFNPLARVLAAKSFSMARISIAE
jgi:hypothetical protein